MRIRRSVMTRSNDSLLSDLDGLLAALGERDVVAGLAQHDREQLAHAPFVVDDEHARVRHGERAA